MYFKAVIQALHFSFQGQNENFNSQVFRTALFNHNRYTYSDIEARHNIRFSFPFKHPISSWDSLTSIQGWAQEIASLVHWSWILKQRVAKTILPAWLYEAIASRMVYFHKVVFSPVWFKTFF